MKKIIVFLFGLLISATPGYAAGVNVTANSVDLVFGSVIVDDTISSAGVGVSYLGQPLYINTRKASGSQMVSTGTLMFESSMTDGYDTLTIKPDITAGMSFPLHSFGTCNIKLMNLAVSPNTAELSTRKQSANISVGGQVQFSGKCAGSYAYKGKVDIPYSIFDDSESVVGVGKVSLPVQFEVKQAGKATQLTDFSFGIVVAGDEGGTVVLSPSTGAYSTTGSVFSATDSHAGVITISGSSGQTVDISSDEQIYLYRGKAVLRADNFTFYPGTHFTLGEGETQLKIGGTLHVYQNQAAGDYSGVLNVYISY